MKHITNNLKNTMQQIIENEISNKCIVEGYIKPNSIVILSHSNGIQENQNIKFQVVFECLVCNPSEGQFINCVAKNITKAGIRAESVDEQPSPFVLFIARDHYFASEYFNSIEENEKFIARVIAQRFELNDKYVSIIAKLVPPSNKKEFKPRLVLDEN
jgi:DNA-directed RNA polymerase subunit E'/Rpb7